MNKKSIIQISFIVFPTILVGTLLFAPISTVETRSNASHSFTIDASMQRVRKILVRTNSIKKIVSMADATLLDQQWLQMQFEINQLLKRDWHLQGSGHLTVETNDSYIGRHEIVLNQAIDIIRERLQVTNQLDQPSGPVRQYESTMLLTPSADSTANFQCTLDLTIKTQTNFLIRGIVKREIGKAAQRSLEKQEQALREIVAQYADDLIIVPKLPSDTE